MEEGDKEKKKRKKKKLASLFSGGKDSTFSILKAREAGHHIACLLTMQPEADDSLLFHYPNSWVTRYQAEAMQIPVISFRVEPGRPEKEAATTSATKGGEARALAEAIGRARSLYGIEGVVHGGMSSRYQKQAFEGACALHGLETFAPLWGIEPAQYMSDLVLRRGFEILVVGVSAMGLDGSWLGKKLDQAALEELAALSKRYGFNMAFEGGEAETLVTDCPLFVGKKLEVRKAEPRWDGQRGIFEIREVELVDKEGRQAG